jgi:SAM-dependent methyltransferase
VFSESAEVYDLIYGEFKNYVDESARLAALLRRVNPSCRSVLDVGCGTGEHMRHLSTHGLRVDGLDLDQRYVDIAARKNPGSRLWRADMVGFDVPERYDAIVCLFSSIGYVRTLEGMEEALRTFRRHLEIGGVIVIEPWFAPGQLDPSFVMRNTAEGHDVRVERVSHLEIDGRLSRLRFDYTLTDAVGVRTATEVHELGLFTTTEMHRAFQAVGLEVEHDESGLDGRGLFIARVCAGSPSCD